MFAVYFYLRYGVSYLEQETHRDVFACARLRDLEEIMAERGVTVDHATLNRWGVK